MGALNCRIEMSDTIELDEAGPATDQTKCVCKNAEKLKPAIRQGVEQSRNALDGQHKLIFKSI
jgi:hypothetical protein